MGSVFPGALDDFTNPTSESKPNDPTNPHSSMHANSFDAIEALEAKVGTTAQANARVHVSSTQPDGVGPYLWVQTNLGVDGSGFTFWIEDDT